MITFNSNCSRVDMVKAQANQIKTQFGGSSGTEKSDPPARKVKSDLQTLDTQIKSGDANKAEVALATTKRDVGAAQTAPHQNSANQSPGAATSSGTLDAYA